MLSQSFGALDRRSEQTELEIRASWTAADENLAPHLSAWATLLCTAAGLEPLPEGVVALGPASLSLKSAPVRLPMTGT